MVVRRAIYALAERPRVTRWISERGMRWGFARRFVAGETFEAALPAVAEMRAKGMRVTLDYLGEAVHDAASTREVTDAYIDILDRIARGDIGASISLKPTQVGLSVSQDLARDNIARITAHARSLGNFVRIDMEDTPTTQATLEVFTSLRAEYDNVGTVVQSYLRRTEQDVRDLNRIGARLRLCKGAYKEPATVAFQDKRAVDANYVKLAELLLDEGTYPAFATHDHRIIEHIKAYAEAKGIDREAFEFQMLYGIRRDYQLQIVEAGYRIRIYVPFGREWLPYYMRRIAERPANALFVLRALLGR